MLSLPQLQYVGRGCSVIDGYLDLKYGDIIQSGQPVVQLYAPADGIGKSVDVSSTESGRFVHAKAWQRYKSVLKPNSDLQLHPNFIRAFEALRDVNAFIDRYGTHVLTSCYLGGYVEVSSKSPLPDDALSHIIRHSSRMYPTPIQAKDSISFDTLKNYWEQLLPSSLAIIHEPQCLKFRRIDTFLQGFNYFTHEQLAALSKAVTESTTAACTHHTSTPVPSARNAP